MTHQERSTVAPRDYDWPVERCPSAFCFRAHAWNYGSHFRPDRWCPSSDRGTVTTATTLTALIVTGLVALGVYAHHLADQDCHQRAQTVEAHELCERAAS
jgi:hypothetical protein